jgi:hypothetical protein
MVGIGRPLSGEEVLRVFSGWAKVINIIGQTWNRILLNY